MTDTTVDVGGNESAAPPVSTEEVDLDGWANETEEAPVAKPRRSNGTYAKQSAESREVANALKATVQGATRPRQAEQADEEPVQEEEQAPRATRKVKGLVNGEETEIDIDDDEFRKLNAVQMAKASQKAFREAAEMRKEADQLRKALETARDQVTKDPMALFKALGVDENKVFEFAQQKALERVYENIDPQTGQPYTPEQQRIIQLQKELSQRQQVDEQQKQEQERIQFEKMKDVVRQDIDRKFTTALKETGLPPTPYTMMRLANLMEQMGPDVDPQMVAPMVLEDVVTEIVHTINTIPVETAVELLGEDFMKALRKYDIDRSRSSKDKFGRNVQKFPGNAPVRQKSNTKITNMDDANDYLENWARGK